MRNRISNEDGYPAGARNIGRFALSLIPLAIGLAASVFLGVWIQAHYFLMGVSQERRTGSFVGAPDPIQVAYVVSVARGPKTSIDKVDINGGAMTVRFHNFSRTEEATNLQIHWVWIAPDETRLGGSWDWVAKIGGPSGLSPGEKGMVTEKDLGTESRASGIQVWVTSN